MKLNYYYTEAMASMALAHFARDIFEYYKLHNQCCSHYILSHHSVETDYRIFYVWVGTLPRRKQYIYSKFQKDPNRHLQMVAWAQDKEVDSRNTFQDGLGQHKFSRCEQV